MTAPVAVRAARLARFEQVMRFPLALSAVLPIAIGLSGDRSTVSALVAVASWLVFLADLVVHVRLSPGYLRTGFGRFDLVIVVLTAPWFLIPGLGESGFLMLARLGRLGRLFLGTRVGRTLMVRIGRVGALAGSSLVLLAWITYQAEKDTNPEFADYGVALWWGIVTMTTVGYGDIVPETTDGRLTGALLMITGLAVLGSLAAILASFLRLDSGAGPDGEQPGPQQGGPDAPEHAGLTSSEDVAALHARLAELHQLVSRLDPAGRPSDGSPSGDVLPHTGAPDGPARSG